MKLVFSSSNGFRVGSQKQVLSRVLRVVHYSTTKTLGIAPSTTRKPRSEELYKRICHQGDPRVSMLPILDGWIEQGNTVTRDELNFLIMRVRSFSRYHHALQISQWMSDRRYIDLSAGDVAVRLGLISKVHGIEQAEKYFANIPKRSKGFVIYDALLKCYVQNKSIEKAEALVQQMKELGFIYSSWAYNSLLILYSKVGQYEKLDSLIEVMKEEGIHPDVYTLNIRLNAYADISDIDGMEKILQRMEEDPNIIMSWSCYTPAAKGYIKAGLFDKAVGILKKSEELITARQRWFAYPFLLTLYAGTGRKEELYRIWNLFKSSKKSNNTTYRAMIASLLKLDDIASAEKILEEWESGDTSYDFRVPNELIHAYCKNDHLEKAEMYVDKAMEKGKQPNADTWDILATGYVKINQIPKAVAAMKAALFERRPGWRPNRDTLAACLAHLKHHEDAEKAEDFLQLLEASGHEAGGETGGKDLDDEDMD